MKIAFISGLCIIALLCAGCAATGSRQENSAPDAGKSPPAGESVSKGVKKPRTPAAKPPQPIDGSVPNADKKPQTNQQRLPDVIVPASYPQRALDNGIEGYVILEYTITKSGSLQDVVVIDSSPPGYFEEAALRAATKFRYDPIIVNGEPIDVPRAQYKMLFKLEYLRPRS